MITRMLRRAAIVAALLCAHRTDLAAQATVVGTTPPSTPAADTVKAALVRQLVDKLHASDQALAALEAGLPAQRTANPRIPAVFWERFLAQAQARRGELGDMIGTVYDHQFSTEELRQLLAFYDTPLGQKLLRTLPALMQESMTAGQVWGAKVATDVVAQLQAEGVRSSP